jgi:hypothetical protein
MGVPELFAQAGFEPLILPISTSKVARVTGVNEALASCLLNSFTLSKLI